MFTTRVDEGNHAMPIGMRIGWLAGHLKAAVMADKLLDTGPYKGDCYCAEDVPPTLERLCAIPSVYNDYEVAGLMREFAGSGGGEAYDRITVVPLGIHSKEVTERLISGFATASVASPTAKPEDFERQSGFYPARLTWNAFLAMAYNRR